MLTARGRVAVLAGCALVAVLVALYAAGQARTGPTVAAGSVRLGPDAGEVVAAYAARARVGLPPPGTVALALVQFAGGRTVADAAAVGAVPVEAVFRVAIPRVQTALRFEPLATGTAAATTLDIARQQAALAAGADVARLGGPGTQPPADGSGTPQPGTSASDGATARAATAAEAAALERPACPCVAALVVSGDGTALRALADAAGVRVVEAAPPGTTLRELALSPLLPEQVLRADPPPDDGPVP